MLKPHDVTALWYSILNICLDTLSKLTMDVAHLSNLPTHGPPICTYIFLNNEKKNHYVGILGYARCFQCKLAPSIWTWLDFFLKGCVSLGRPLAAGSRYYILTFPPPADILLSRANSGKLQQIYNPFVSLQLDTFSPHRTSWVRISAFWGSQMCFRLPKWSVMSS